MGVVPDGVHVSVEIAGVAIDETGLGFIEHGRVPLEEESCTCPI